MLFSPSLNLRWSPLLCVGLLFSLLLSLVQSTLAAPIHSRDSLSKREILIAMIDGSPPESELVDLLDQWKVIEKAIQNTPEDDPFHEELIRLQNRKARELLRKADGIAAIYSATDLPLEETESPEEIEVEPTPTITEEPEVPEETDTQAPIVTVVPQEDTSIIVLASEGTTETRTINRGGEATPTPTPTPRAPSGGGGSGSGGSGNGGGGSGQAGSGGGGGAAGTQVVSRPLPASSTGPFIPGISGFSESAGTDIFSTGSATSSMPWTTVVVSVCSLTLWLTAF